jgi:hypothetical protein
MVVRNVAALGLTVLLLCGWEAEPVRAQETPAAGELIDRVVDAYGGRDRLAAVQSYRIEGSVRAIGRDGDSRMIRVFARPSKLRVELHYPDSPEIRVLDGEHGWRMRGSEMAPVQGFMHAAMLLQAARANLPWILDVHRDIVRVVGPVRREGGVLWGLEMALGSSMLFRVYFDPDSHRIVETLGLLRSEEMQTHFETRFADFRTVDGVLFPFVEENYASGVHTASTVIERVTINPELSPEAFLPRD